MLSRVQRLTSRRSFTAAVRAGSRAGSGTLVVHLLVPVAPPTDADTPGPVPPPARGGLVVGRAVGGAVGRNQVKRRLRHLLGERLATLPPGSLLVVRALPRAAAASTDRLGADLDRALRRAARDAGARGRTTAGAAR